MLKQFIDSGFEVQNIFMFGDVLTLTKDNLTLEVAQQGEDHEQLETPESFDEFTDHFEMIGDETRYTSWCISDDAGHVLKQEYVDLRQFADVTAYINYLKTELNEVQS